MSNELSHETILQWLFLAVGAFIAWLLKIFTGKYITSIDSLAKKVDQINTRVCVLESHAPHNHRSEEVKAEDYG